MDRKIRDANPNSTWHSSIRINSQHGLQYCFTCRCEKLEQTDWVFVLHIQIVWILLNLKQLTSLNKHKKRTFSSKWFCPTWFTHINDTAQCGLTTTACCIRINNVSRLELLNCVKAPYQSYPLVPSLFLNVIPSVLG